MANLKKEQKKNTNNFPFSMIKKKEKMKKRKYNYVFIQSSDSLKTF